MNIFITKLRYFMVSIALLLGSVSSDTIASGYYNVGNWYQGVTVTYLGNGETSGAAPAPTNYVSGTTFTVASNSGNLAKNGYIFAGWNTQADGNGVNYTAGSGAMTLGSENVTLYAKWSFNSYSVTYDGNGSTGGSVPVTASYNYGTTVTASNNTGSLARTGYSFAGWNTAANGSGTSFAAGSGTFTITSNVTLYAQWTINSYTVTFNANGGTGSPSVASVSGNYNTSVTLATVGTLARTGYTFAGWNTATNGSGTDYSAGASYTVTASVTLYAKWTINSYTVTFNANGGTGSPSVASVSGNYNTSVTLATVGTLARSGYIFTGWNTATNGSGTDYSAGVSYTVSANITLYARWAASCGDTSANNCYSGTNAAQLKSLGSTTTPTGKSITWNSTYSVWLESGAGTRVLAADGTDNWQPQLNANGRSFSASLLNKANVAGRACPSKVYVDDSNKLVANRCLYYDAGNAAQTLDGGTGTTDQSTPGSFRLKRWTDSTTGNGTDSSWYEGNIQTCASKGMRLPTLYETTAAAPSTTYRPTDFAVAAGDWSTSTTGVPSATGASYTWTSSAYTYASNGFWGWAGTGATSGYAVSYAVRCVVP
jgi:uncharacterized repeat protein (TIGR02543 family)